MTTKNPIAHVTTAQIAVKAGVSRTTVSFALRHHPKIPPATAARVQAAAAELGYRPNPRLAALMAHIRGSRPVAAGERIAFLWVHTPRAEAAKDPFLQRGSDPPENPVSYRLSVKHSIMGTNSNFF